MCCVSRSRSSWPPASWPERRSPDRPDRLPRASVPRRRSCGTGRVSCASPTGPGSSMRRGHCGNSSTEAPCRCWPYATGRHCRCGELSRVSTENRCHAPTGCGRWTFPGGTNSTPMTAKSQALYDAGVRTFALFFDDIAGQPGCVDRIHRHRDLAVQATFRAAGAAVGAGAVDRAADDLADDQRRRCRGRAPDVRASAGALGQTFRSPTHKPTGSTSGRSTAAEATRTRPAGWPTRWCRPSRP